MSIHASTALLSVNNASIVYETATGVVKAVTDVSFDLKHGETLGIAGESGCGKSTLAMGILQLLNSPGRLSSGTVTLNGADLTKLDSAELQSVRWAQLSLIPQGAMNSLNPTMTVRAQLIDVIRTHQPSMSKKDRNQRVVELLDMVDLPIHSAKQFPHELSGGMKQRVCIAMAIALKPKLIIADEATSALDVVVQRRVAQTLMDVKERLAVSMIMIGHDIGLMAQLTDKLAVMYAGCMVELGPTEKLITTPAHPYTKLLIEALPRIDSRQPLQSVAGVMHDPRETPSGCIFHLRCPYAEQICREQKPPLSKHGHGNQVSEVHCHFPLSFTSSNKQDGETT